MWKHATGRGVERLLHPNARQVSVLITDPAHPSGVFEGKDERLAYTFGLLGKFDSLVWVDKDWTVSADGTRVLMQARATAWRTIPRPPIAIPMSFAST